MLSSRQSESSSNALSFTAMNKTSVGEYSYLNYMAVETDVGVSNGMPPIAGGRQCRRVCIT